MKLILFCLLLYSPTLLAKDYKVEIHAGDKITAYEIKANSKKRVLSVHSSRKEKATKFNKENSQFLMSKLQEVLKEESNKKEHCPRNYISVKTSREIRIACIQSRTKVAAKSKDLVNALRLTEFYK